MMEARSVKVYPPWNITQETEDTMNTICPNFVLTRRYHYAIYYVNDQPLTLCSFHFMDNFNIFIMDYNHTDDLHSIVEMIKMLILQIRSRFENVNILVDKCSNGLLMALFRCTYYCVPFGRSPLFQGKDLFVCVSVCVSVIL